MTAIDPVCGMQVDENTAEWKTTYQAQTYYFCAPGCLRSFEKEPAKYLQANAAGQHEQHPGHEHDHGQQHG
jgi:YHS domain-containing protein